MLRRLCTYVVEAMHWYFPIVIPLQVRQLYCALPWIVAIFMEYLYIVKEHRVVVVVVVVVVLSDSNTTPGNTTLLSSALDCGNKE